MNKTFHAIGLMSGSSLDGLDVAFCRLDTEQQGSSFRVEKWELLEAATLPLSTEWQARLRQLPTASAFELANAHAAFGRYLGGLVNAFFTKRKLTASEVDLIASHGHTIFHEPAKGFTLQIGDGAALAAVTGCTVVSDFRTADVALGGQGAPLAPMADKVLFPGYDFYLNLGGIANITCNTNGRFVAFDVTGANQVLNALAGEVGQPFDEGGKLAASGRFDGSLFEKLNRLPYLHEPYPKSLSNQWVQENMVTTCLQAPGPVEDRLHTVCQHVAFQLAQSFRQVVENERFRKEKYHLLATGGGAFNGYLMQCIQEKNPNVELVIPSENVVKFKEACLMALLGVMRLEGVPNCMSSVTGARRDAVGGGVYFKG
ncbi:MAG: anhydro-N-acetylmuramic acid kinase [Bacteroidetes bacterium]|nr:anhydro-N-acetylmuramic acid kinase [Bacteroidota bacterium]